ncbi:MAG: PAS domain S-box protein [Leptospiraceae bacterium]|nr:PAS domain S-box protein [Leptospiraceae bacterium]MCP5500451.1 PAS domain S-box protein [Leptospiraceae bacterium]
MTISQIKILLVEDVLSIAVLEKFELEDRAYQVNYVLSGEEALKEIIEQNQSYDLILMDIDLGSDMDGIRTAKEILKRRNIPILFLSSHTEQELVEKTEKITSYGYVVKNSGITILDTSIKMALKLFKAHQDLEQKEKLLQLIAENYPNSYVLIFEKDFKISFISGQSLKKHGATKLEEIFGLNSFGTFKENYLFIKDYIIKTLHGEECGFDLEIGNEYYFCRTVPLSLSNQRIEKVLFVTEEITERKRTEEIIKSSETKYRTLFNSSQDAIIIDDENGHIECNDTAYKMFGCDNKEDFLSREPKEFSPERQADGSYSFPQAYEKVHLAFKNGKEHFKWTHCKKNGEEFPVEVTLSTMVLFEKPILQAVVRDLSGNKFL